MSKPTSVSSHESFPSSILVDRGRERGKVKELLGKILRGRNSFLIPKSFLCKNFLVQIQVKQRESGQDFSGNLSSGR